MNDKNQNDELQTVPNGLSGVYILHFPVKIDYAWADKFGDQQHYVGVSKDILNRYNRHSTGQGSEMTKAAYRQGVKPILAAIFPSGRNKLKIEEMITDHGASLFCPVCQIGVTPDQRLSRVSSPPKEREERRQAIRELAPCPTCKAPIGKVCRRGPDRYGRPTKGNHSQRIKAANMVFVTNLAAAEAAKES